MRSKRESTGGGRKREKKGKKTTGKDVEGVDLSAVVFFWSWLAQKHPQLEPQKCGCCWLEHLWLLVTAQESDFDLGLMSGVAIC